jgi:hypothetical protein
VAPVLLRAAPWTAVLAASGAGAVAGTLAIGFGPTGAGVMLVHLALVLVSGAAACALEEPAAAVVEACPTQSWRRLLPRVVAATAPLTVGAGVLGTWWARADVQAFQLLQLAGCWLLGLSVATLARTRMAEPAEVVAPGLVLVLLVVVLVEPVARRVHLFPVGSDPGAATRTWLVVLVLCLAVLVTVVPERRWRPGR